MRHVTGNVVKSYPAWIDFTFIDNMLEHSQHPKRLGPTMEQLRQPQSRIIGIEPAAKNDSVDMFQRSGVAAE